MSTLHIPIIDAWEQAEASRAKNPPKPIVHWSRGQPMPVEENVVSMPGGFYLVRTQAGFRRLVKHLDVYDPKNWPQAYPCVVSDAGRGNFCIARVSTFQEALKGA